MRFFLSLMTVLVSYQLVLAGNFNITCFYDTFSIKRGGSANFTENDLKTSLEYCNHVIYGYVGLRNGTFDLNTLHSIQQTQFAQVKKIKNQYRHIKFFVSLGGNRDPNAQNYIELLKASDKKQEHFINSVKQFLKKYSFDGLDLAYQFPQKKVKKSFVKKLTEKAGVKSVLKTLNKKAKEYVGGKQSKTNSVKSNTNMSKHQFTALLNKLQNSLSRNRLMLSLTVLPHVNVTKYINIPAVMEYLDFVNLGTFDYSTPEFTPEEANYLAPLQRAANSPQHSNIEHDVREWTSQHFPRSKLNIGIPAYGRTWKFTKQLKSSVMPIRTSLKGPAGGGELTHTPGLLSWPEICLKLPKMTVAKDKKYGNYAYHSADTKGGEGILITYEDRDSIGAKAEYVERNSLGGIALFDLSLDDFRGKCKQGKYPALKAIKFILN